MKSYLYFCGFGQKYPDCSLVFTIAGLITSIGAYVIYNYYGSLSPISSKAITIFSGSYIFGTFLSVASIMMGNALFSSNEMRAIYLDSVS